MTVSVSDVRRVWLTELYQANSAAVFNQCRRLLKSPEDAADAMQEVFLRAATSLSEDVGGSQARAWLNTVARNYCIDLIRRRDRLGSAVTTLAATADEPGRSVESVEDRDLLLAILPQLAQRERVALWQSAVEDLPLTEIARTSRISYLAAAQLLHRARRRALVLATRLAVILGLFRLGQAARRSRFIQHSQQIAAVVGVPIVMAVVILSSAGPQPAVPAQAKVLVPKIVAQNPPPIQHPVSPPNDAPPGASPVPPPVTVAAVSAVSAVSITVPKPPPGVKPTPPPAPIDRDKDHGKGRDRDDAVHKHGGGSQGGGRH